MGIVSSLHRLINCSRLKETDTRTQRLSVVIEKRGGQNMKTPRSEGGGGTWVWLLKRPGAMLLVINLIVTEACVKWEWAHVCLLICFFRCLCEGGQSRSESREKLQNNHAELGTQEDDSRWICSILSANWTANQQMSFLRRYKPFVFPIICFEGSKGEELRIIGVRWSFLLNIFRWRCLCLILSKREWELGFLPDRLLPFRRPRLKSSVWQESAFISLSGLYWCFPRSKQEIRQCTHGCNYQNNFLHIDGLRVPGKLNLCFPVKMNKSLFFPSAS